MEGGVVILGIAGGLLGVIEPGFRPIAAGSVVLGAAVAVFLVWRRRSESRPTISRHARKESDGKPIEPQ
jgi:hypothetical protein